MAENYKILYEQAKKMLALYQDKIVPGMREQLANCVEVVHGRWIDDVVESYSPFTDSPIWIDVMQCSVCKEYIDGSHPKNYCPNCGAKMDGDGNG